MVADPLRSALSRSGRQHVPGRGSWWAAAIAIGVLGCHPRQASPSAPRAESDGIRLYGKGCARVNGYEHYDGTDYVAVAIRGTCRLGLSPGGFWRVLSHEPTWSTESFVAGETYIRTEGRCFDPPDGTECVVRLDFGMHERLYCTGARHDVVAYLLELPDQDWSSVAASIERACDEHYVEPPLPPQPASPDP